MFETYGNPTYTCTVITVMLNMVAERNLCILCGYWYNVILSTATLFEYNVRTVDVFHVISNEEGISQIALNPLCVCSSTVQLQLM